MDVEERLSAVSLSGYALLCVMAAVVFAGASAGTPGMGITPADAVRIASEMMDIADKHWRRELASEVS